MPRVFMTVLLTTLGAATAGAQSLAQRVTAADGNVQVIYPSRPGACGDGQRFVGHVIGGSTYYSSNSGMRTGPWTERPCLHGPARVVATVIGGAVTRLWFYVGPVPEARADVRSISASAPEAAAWLGTLVAQSSTHTASNAMLPLIAADGSDPWALLLKVARDDARSQDARRAALLWLGVAVTDRLGISETRDDSDADQMRTQAVFVLSQRPKSESVPELIDIVRTSTHPSARRAAIFWLGQTGDPRAADVYADLLGLR
jgi:hypothetical protein